MNGRWRLVGDSAVRLVQTGRSATTKRRRLCAISTAVKTQ